MSKLDTREALIRVGTQIIADQGFNTTGINAVLSTAGVPKGSFYYYFPSKEDFGLAVIDGAAEDYAAVLAGFLNDTRHAPLQRIRNYLDAGVAALTTRACTRGCLIGDLSQELASRNEAFRARLDDVWRNWERQFANCLEAARAAGEIPPDSDTGQLAKFLLAGWEGAILRAKVMKSVEPMQVFITILFTQVLRTD